jgi:hypothetical protein
MMHGTENDDEIDRYSIDMVRLSFETCGCDIFAVINVCRRRVTTCANCSATFDPI